MPIPRSPFRIMRVSGPARTRGMKDHGEFRNCGDLPCRLCGSDFYWNRKGMAFPLCIPRFVP
jgi:hypothetical protein